MSLSAQLAKIDWAPSATSPTRLTRLGVEYGMTGKQSKPPPLHHTRQVHGTRVVEASEARTAPTSTIRIEADAILTRQAGEIIGVRTADCLPILLAGPEGHAVLAAHAGWRGLTAGVLGFAVGELAGHGIRESELTALVGPAISRARFPVGPEVVEAIRGPELGLKAEQVERVLTPGEGDRWHVDLAVSAVFALVNAGVDPERITVVQECTFGHADRWYSYRRDGKGVGSNWTWIRAR